MSEPKLSKVEYLKAESDYLKGDLPEQLASDSTHVTEEGYQLLKFSGMYQQDDRDTRKERRKEGRERDYSFMVRTKLPGGALTAEQYLAHDDLAGRYGNETLRFTTRQGIQLHGILKGDIKPLLQAFNDALVTTSAACGDVVRNVMACPAPENDRQHALLLDVARQIESHLLPRSDTYYDLWLDGERVKVDKPHYTPAVDEVEPIYGKTYLPRKFKIGIAFPNDNCVDVFTQDIGIVPVLEDDTLQGFDILVGGGLGMSHTDEDTFPRLGDALGFVQPDEIVKAVEVIVTIQRDYGNRENRKRSRMKYLVHEWGIERFRQEFNTRFGRPIDAWVEVGPFQIDDHLGWRAQGDGRYYYGIPIENGRIKDDGAARVRSGLRKVAETFGTELRITPQHNLLVTNLEAHQQDDLLSVLREYGIRTKDDISNARRYAIACPALPTCGLAIAESERVMPQIIDGLEAELEALGLGGEEIAIRMTGCPNGCARPYTAELSFVGRSLDQYNVYVGGSFEGLHLVQEYAELIRGGDLVATVRPLFELWRQERQAGERFGDYCRRKGIDSLKARAAELQTA
jgi:sulfite reductase (ferredoxin)